MPREYQQLLRELEQAKQKGDATLIHDKIVKIMEVLLGEHYVRRGRTGQKDEDPFENFRRRHRHHDRAGALLTAKQKGDRETVSKLAKRIKVDGWRGYLAKIHPAEISSMYKYIQKADGRRPPAFRHQCSGPLVRDGQAYTTSQPTQLV